MANRTNQELCAVAIGINIINIAAQSKLVVMTKVVIMVKKCRLECLFDRFSSINHSLFFVTPFIWRKTVIKRTLSLAKTESQVWPPCVHSRFSQTYSQHAQVDASCTQVGRTLAAHWKQYRSHFASTSFQWPNGEKRINLHT